LNMWAFSISYIFLSMCDLLGLLCMVRRLFRLRNGYTGNLTADLVKADRPSGLAAVVFADARWGFARDDILPLVPYWNQRSKTALYCARSQIAISCIPSALWEGRGEGIRIAVCGRARYTFFFCGYVRDEADDSVFVTRFDPGQRFHARTFAETVEEFERETDWSCRCDTPIILTRAYLPYHKETNEHRALF